jgi:hypothetical protein
MNLYHTQLGPYDMATYKRGQEGPVEDTSRFSL